MKGENKTKQQQLTRGTWYVKNTHGVEWYAPHLCWFTDKLWSAKTLMALAPLLLPALPPSLVPESLALAVYNPSVRSPSLLQCICCCLQHRCGCCYCWCPVSRKSTTSELLFPRGPVAQRAVPTAAALQDRRAQERRSAPTALADRGAGKQSAPNPPQKAHVCSFAPVSLCTKSFFLPQGVPTILKGVFTAGVFLDLRS